MDPSSGSPRLARFGIFEVDLRSGELRKPGSKIRLQDKPLQILTLLLEHPGEVVTREELQKRLWGDGIVVDFEHSINTAVKRLREALGDDAEHPRYIETLPRYGYRFIAPVEGGAMQELPVPTTGPRAIQNSPPRRHWVVALVGGLVVAVVAVLFTLNIAGLRSRVLRAIGAVPEPPLQIQSIAVLPLENLSGDPGQEYFADGMTEALVTDLGQISALRVISRTSVMQYKGTRKPLPQIARELNVDAIVEGTVQRSGDRVRITANLLHAPTDRHLWAETYERDLRDVLALQSEVARAIATQVQIKVTPNEQVRLTTTRPVNPEAHEAYLKGRYFLGRLTEVDLHKAVEYALRAVRIDPGYAPAYGLLATTYWQSSVFEFGSLPNKEALRRTRATAVKALQIDETLAEAHSAMGTVLFFDDWDWAGAEREYKRAIQLNPSFADADVKYAWYLIAMGRPDESLREAKRALELDPVSVGANHTATAMYYMARQYDQAIEQARRRIEIDPNSSSPYYWLFQCCWGKDQLDEAIAAWQKCMILRGESAQAVAAMRHAYEVGGIRAYWRWRVEQDREARQGYLWPVALWSAQAREIDRSFRWLEKAYEQRDPGLTVLRVEPLLDPIRSDPRFQDLVRRMKFPP